METSATLVTHQSREKTTCKPASYLFARFGLLGVLGLLALAVWKDQVAIVILLALVLAAAGVARLWSRLSLSHVVCQRHVSERRLFPGEQVELTIRVENRKLLPLAWIQVDDEIPFQVAHGVSLIPTERRDFGLLSGTASLRWHAGTTWQYHLSCRKRGYYRLGPMTVTSGDIFGFYPRSATWPQTDHVIVYPRLYPIEEMGIPSRYPLGDVRDRRPVFKDPTRMTGVREYTPHDSLRHVHWKASARQQSLQVKTFESTTTLELAIFLDVDGFEQAETEDDFELAVSTAASVASFALKKRNPVGMYVNALQADSGTTVNIRPGSSAGQLVSILEALAKTTARPSVPFGQFLERERRRLPWGATVVLVTSKPSEATLASVASLAENGYKVLVLEVGDRDESSGRPNTKAIWLNVAHDRGSLKIGARESR